MIAPDRQKEILALVHGEWDSNLQAELKTTDEEQLDAAFHLKALEFCSSHGDFEELHFFAENVNWDFGTEFLEAILLNPNCDFGTAKLIFWLASPDYYQEFAQVMRSQRSTGKDGTSSTRSWTYVLTVHFDRAK